LTRREKPSPRKIPPCLSRRRAPNWKHQKRYKKKISQSFGRKLFPEKKETSLKKNRFLSFWRLGVAQFFLLEKECSGFERKKRGGSLLCISLKMEKNWPPRAKKEEEGNSLSSGKARSKRSSAGKKKMALHREGGSPSCEAKVVSSQTQGRGGGTLGSKLVLLPLQRRDCSLHYPGRH